MFLTLTAGNFRIMSKYSNDKLRPCVVLKDLPRTCTFRTLRDLKILSKIEVLKMMQMTGVQLLHLLCSGDGRVDSQQFVLHDSMIARVFNPYENLLVFQAGGIGEFRSQR